MKIIVIEDSDYKFDNIKEILNNLSYDDITREKSYCSGLRNIVASGNKYDVLILDMQFPIDDRDKEIDAEAGLAVLQELKRTKTKLPVIMCSSRKLNIEGVVACIHYDSSVYMEPMFKEAIAAATIKTFYHGSSDDFEIFECPAYFMDTKKAAIVFAESHDDTAGKLYKCAVKMNTPYKIDLNGQSWGGFFIEDSVLFETIIAYLAGDDEEELEYFNETGLTVNFLADYIESLGDYDSLICYNTKEADDSVSTQYVVFKPESITILGKEEVN